jgi:hypothetical protein
MPVPNNQLNLQSLLDLLAAGKVDEAREQIERLQSAIEHLNREKEAAKRISEALAVVDASGSKIIDAQRQALDRAAVAQAKFVHNYEHTAHDPLKAQARLNQASIKTSFAAAENYDSTEKRVADKTVDDLEQRGLLTHAAALKAKEQLDLDFEARRLERQQARDRAEESEVQRQQGNKEIALDVDAGSEQEAERSYETAVQARVANEALGKSDRVAAQKRQAGLEFAEGSAKSDVEFYRHRMQKDRDSIADLGEKLQSTQSLNQIKEAGAQADFRLDAAAHILEGHVTNLTTFLYQVNRLAAAMSQMSPQAIADLARRVDTIESAQSTSRNYQGGQG